MTAAEITQSFYRTWGRGELDELCERFLTAHSVLDNPLPALITFGGLFEGPQGFVRYAAQITEALQIEAFGIDEVLVEGDRVVVLGHETSRVKATDKRYTMSWVHVLTLRNGRVEHMREYNDTAAMAAAFA